MLTLWVSKIGGTENGERVPRDTSLGAENPFLRKCRFHMDGIKYRLRSKTQCVALLKRMNEVHSLATCMGRMGWEGGC